MIKKTTILIFLVLFVTNLYSQHPPLFRIRTITAGVNLSGLTDTLSIKSAIEFLKKAKHEYISRGYEVQTLRISTQNFHTYLRQHSYDGALPFLARLDAIAKGENIMLSIGQILPAEKNPAGITGWAVKLIQSTSNISFSLPISSLEKGIHFNSIRAASGIISAISNLNNGEANFRFTASANCPPGIPFFPAAYHDGKNAFAIGLESANLVGEVFNQSKPENARQELKDILEKNLIPVQRIAEELSRKLAWQYNGIDASPAPGLDASIGKAIEAYSRQPFGSPSTLRTCALITDVLKSLDIKKCGYSGLMLPIIEDKVLAQRAMEGRYTVQELLLYSSVSGTGLDVVPIPGDTPAEVLENILADVASLSLKYGSKALSARLFLIPGKKAGEIVKFENPYLTSSVVMKCY